MSEGLREAARFLRCPYCGGDVELAGGPLRCARGHSFDVARQGYVSMLGGGAHTGTGDTAPMVEARSRLLAAGHFAPIGEAVAAECERALAGTTSGCVVDLGAGTGWYLAQVLERVPDAAGLALDTSKPALRRAARAHPRIGAVAADVWGELPVRSEAADVVLSVFAPRNGPEIARILRPGGALVVATPTGRHLEELVAELGLLTVDERKRERLGEKLGPFVAQVRETTCETTVRLGHDDLRTVVGMGPSALHVEAAELESRIARLPDPVAVTASVTVASYERR